MTDRWVDDECTDRRTHGKIILLTHTFTIRKSGVARLVEFQPVD